MAAPGWEMGFIRSSAPSNAISFTTTNSTSPAYLYGLPSSDTLRIDDLLDFTSHHEDLFASSSSAADPHLLPPPDHPSSFPADSSSKLFSSFPDDLYIPSEEAAELEWLSRFVDDSFSDVPLSAYKPVSDHQQQQQQHQHQHLRTEQSAPAPGRAARSKRCKANSWSGMQAVPSQSSSSPSTTSSSSSSDFPAIKPKLENNSTVSVDNNDNTRNVGYKGKNAGSGGEGGGVMIRRCTHCSSEKTPQWRTGPLGPKTLCNACGVRYKSGRLVPEYRPAASPTFILTQHSNSHRKVLELRRQKELLLIRHDNHSSASAAAVKPELLYHDYKVC